MVLDEASGISAVVDVVITFCYVMCSAKKVSVWLLIDAALTYLNI